MKLTADLSRPDTGHLPPARFCNSVGGIRAEPFCIDDIDDFKEGLEKLKKHKIPSFAEKRGPIAPAYYPASKEEMMRNLEARWDAIDRRIAERERNPSPPPFGYEINRLFTPGRSNKADTTARDLAIGEWKKKRQL